MSLSLVIADDHPLYREGVARVLAEAEGIDVLAQADDASSALAAVERHRPDLVLLDVSMPGGGIAALRSIIALPEPPVAAMLTVSEEDDDILRALKIGARGYILKGVGGRDLVRIVRDLVNGRSYVSPSLAGRILAAMHGGAARSPLEDLTKREEDILRRVAEGLSNKEIARLLSLQEKTVKHYMTAILQKLQVRNRTEAALMAQKHWQDD